MIHDTIFGFCLIFVGVTLAFGIIAIIAVSGLVIYELNIFHVLGMLLACAIFIAAMALLAAHYK